MKFVLLLITIFILGFHSNGQDYKLIPDSCTYCFYQVDDGFGSFYSKYYHIDPFSDTTILGHNYKQIFNDGSYLQQPIGVRQTGNKVFGILEDSTQEYLIMDFDANIGDTIFGLYSDEFFFNAIVLHKDSTQVSTNNYVHWMELQGDTVYGNSWTVNVPWTFRWNERGLCSQPYGGYTFNLPVNDFVINYLYAFPFACTTDTLFHPNYQSACTSCSPTLGITELKDSPKIITKIVDLTGRETQDRPNTVLIYIYSDGTTEKVFRIE